MIVSPCKDCPERFVGCHSSCEKYKQYRSELDAFKAIRAADKDERAFASEIKGGSQTPERSQARFRQEA